MEKDDEMPKCTVCGRIPEREGWDLCWEHGGSVKVSTVERSEGCTCDVSALGKVLRVDCPVCFGKEPDAYPAERMHAEDGGVLGELTDSNSIFNLVPWLKECTEKDGWTLDREIMIFRRDKDGDDEQMTFREACEKYREERIKAVNAPMTEEQYDELLEAAMTKVTDKGLMNYIEERSPWPEKVEKGMDEFLETAFGPSELQENFQRAVGLLRRWHAVRDVEFDENLDILDQDTEAFLKEIDGDDEVQEG